ncbi:MAG: CehA/McbA family metallohydrolase [Candidatus Hydrogenedentes bacterium]|nr:CehA/McbA family metallohydrolase [Candidatus Hydrogenedentota bacterium]
MPLHGNNIVFWGWTQTRAAAADFAPWLNWLWAWQNPNPEKRIVGLRFEPKNGVVIVSGVSAGKVSSLPLRWEPRRKAVLRLPKNVEFDFNVDKEGRLKQIQLDLGQVISAQKQTMYRHAEWSDMYNNKVPEVSKNTVLIEYTAHPEARFHLSGGKTVPVAKLQDGKSSGPMTAIAPATQRVRLRVVEKASNRPVPVKLHVHGEAGEYLAPVDRHRIPNPGWYEDYSTDFLNQNIHYCTYIFGETVINLPLGRVYIEVSKGFEIRPVRAVLNVGPDTNEITIPIEKVLPWRERGWVTADTHVHFLAPPTAQLEGSAEGVNVVCLLASQWGELMTNVGDFDGKTTFGSKEAGGDGEWLVRVGTENRQHVLGHISLIGYHGNIIAPMCSSGPDEAALGDPVSILMTEWAQKCKQQGGLVVIPHFPNPRAETAATLVSGNADAIEMTSWGNLYNGIDPYSLSDWYRYLNCGYFFPAVGGTDKMSANTAVGTVRTYACLQEGEEFTHEAWKAAVRSGHTFVSYGPLLEFSIEGKPAGTWIDMARNGGTVDVTWQAASVTIPMTRIDLIVNGEIRETKSLQPWEDSGHWSVKIARSSWLAILVRGKYPDKPEIITAHSSPVMVRVEGSPFFSAADTLTILEQIEGALAYLDTVGTRKDEETYKRMRMLLTGEYRKLHNQLHQLGHFHEHTVATDHAEHHGR